jgi:hypothetical protein
MHFNISSYYNPVLKFLHKPQIIIFVFPVCKPSISQQELHTPFRHNAADCLLANSEKVLQANLRITTCQET